MVAPHLPAAAKAWTDGLKATKTIWNQAMHSFEDTGFPDYNVRAECAEKIWVNAVGRPIERSKQVTGNYKELSELIEDIKGSPEAQRLLQSGFFSSLLSNAKGKERPPTHESEKKPDSEQEAR